MFFQPQHPRCPPGSGFLVLCLALQRACPVTSQGLARPPRLLPGPGLAGASREKSCGLFTSWARGGMLQSTCLLRVRVRVRVRGLPFPGSLSGSRGWEPVCADPRCHLMGNFRNGSLTPLSAPRSRGPSSVSSDRPDDSLLTNAFAARTPLLLGDATEAQGHIPCQLTSGTPLRPFSSRFHPQATKEPRTA